MSGADVDRSSSTAPARGALRRRTPFIAVVAALAVVGALVAFGVIELPANAAVTTHRAFNGIEAAIWIVAGAVVLGRTRCRAAPQRAIGAVAAAHFFLFGASDLVEIRTGTWFEPWWLLAWKAECAAALVVCLALYRRCARRARADTDDSRREETRGAARRDLPPPRDFG